MNESSLYMSKGADSTAVVDTNGAEGVDPKDWRLKSMDVETIQAARRAARKNGLRLGSWVARAINQAAMCDLSGTVISAGSEIQSLKEIQDRLSRLEARVEGNGKLTEQTLQDVKNDIRTMTFSLLQQLQKSQLDKAI